MEREFIQALSLIKASKYREEIMNAIGDNIKLPSEISAQTDIRLNHVSSVLRTLKEHGLVECLNEESKRGRLYKLTELGKNAIREIRK